MHRSEGATYTCTLSQEREERTEWWDGRRRGGLGRPADILLLLDFRRLRADWRLLGFCLSLRVSISLSLLLSPTLSFFSLSFSSFLSHSPHSLPLFITSLFSFFLPLCGSLPPSLSLCALWLVAD